VGQLRIVVDTSGETPVVAVSGDLDLEGGRSLDAMLRSFAGSELVLDLGDVSFIDSAGLQVILLAGRRSKVVLPTPSSSVQRIIAAAGQSAMLEVEPSPSDSAPPSGRRAGGSGRGSTAQEPTGRIRTPDPAPADAGAPEEGEPEAIQLARELSELKVAYLDLDDLFAELLERAVDVLGVDTAVVLLTDASGSELVARAARGIEEEVRQGVRITVGEGFAGRIAAERRALIVDHVDETTVVNPILRDRGLQAMLGVPLVAGDTVIGVLHVGTTGSRRFDDQDAALLAVIADRVAAAVQVRLLEADRGAAEAIQRSLLPSVPASLAEFECAARYVPALRGGIGGDWYDAFMLDDGEVWLVVGDVAGHGLRAAIVMGRLRSAIRSYALLGERPDAVLTLADRKVAHFELGSLTTVAIATLPPPYDQAHIALAGHPPLIRAAPGCDAVLVEASPGPPLGVDLGPRPAATDVPMTRGSVLVGFTDGLVERRGELLDEGFERVRRAVSATTPAAVCNQVMSAALGRHVPDDDVALIVMRRRAVDPQYG
jgi:anti-anti-sigma factor